MKLFMDKVLLGAMMFGLAISGGVLLPSAVGAEEIAETPIEAVAETPEAEPSEAMPETPEAEPSESEAETPEVAETPEPEATEPEASEPEASEPEETSEATPEAPKEKKNKKGLKILFGILQLLGNELTK